jgi:hypothetical protein
LAPKATEAVSPFKVGDLSPAPDYIQKDRRGLENMTKDDILMPRLALAQALSPQVTEGDPNRIEGLKAGDLFNSLNGTIYGGRTPIFVQIIRKDRPRAMEFRPILEGGGVIDPNVPIGDPRLEWGENGEKPSATLFRDYLANILPSRELIALSFKSSGIKVAKALNGLIAMRGNRPIFAGVYAIWTDIELKPKPHQVFRVDNAGWASPEDLAYGEQMYEALKDFDIASHIDRANPNDDPDAFDPDALEAQAQTANPGM